ncbi:MAG: hypothetical protein ACLQT6_08915 [Desulfomonilaceae bacterium]
MKRLILSAIALVLLWVACAYAGCAIKYRTTVYLHWKDMEIVDRVQALSSKEDWMQRMLLDIKRGAAVWVEEGTPVKILEVIPPNGLLLEIKGIPVYAYKRHIQCD